jgi:hypothetical protein
MFYVTSQLKLEYVYARPLSVSQTQTHDSHQIVIARVTQRVTASLHNGTIFQAIEK